MSQERFSRRFGHGPTDQPITIRDDAPDVVRGAILKIAEGELGISPSQIRAVLCTVLRTLPDGSNWSDYPNVWDECQSLVEGAPWYRVYDFVEALFQDLVRRHQHELAHKWQALINEYFIEAGVGWQMRDGLLFARGPEAFQASVESARDRLAEAELPTARQEIHEALRDLSRRPDPDLTGAVHHAMAALECTAREA
jgi:AbiJ-like protein